MDNANSDAIGLPDMPTAFLRKLAQALWEDGKDLARLNCTCRDLRSVCGESALWQQLLIRRFGRSVVPGKRPEAAAGHTRPLEQPGWVFYQGRDGSEESDQQLDSTDLHFRAQQLKGADAFTTSNKVIYMLHKPQDAWKHFSFNPKQGMYVKESVVVENRLLPPQQHAAGDTPWPPKVPGWIYFPNCVRTGYTSVHGEPYNVLQRYQQLTDVLESASNDRDVVAVTTRGELQNQLHPQACWIADPSYNVGLYVKAKLVKEMQLMQPPPVPDYCTLYAKLDTLRLDASHMLSMWLDDKHLQLRHADISPADSRMLLHMKRVRRLDVVGSVHGVPPGDYEVCWVVSVRNAIVSRNSEFRLSAEAVPANPAAASNTGTSSLSSNCDGSGASANGDGTTTSGASDSEQPNRVTMQCTGANINELRERCVQRAATWGMISGGILHVSKFSTVKLRFDSHDDALKSGMCWAYVDLKPWSKPQQPPVIVQVCTYVVFVCLGVAAWQIRV